MTDSERFVALLDAFDAASHRFQDCLDAERTDYPPGPGALQCARDAEKAARAEVLKAWEALRDERDRLNEHATRLARERDHAETETARLRAEVERSGRCGSCWDRTDEKALASCVLCGVEICEGGP